MEGSRTGIPMHEVLIEQNAGAQQAPVSPFEKPTTALNAGETEWMRNKVSRETNVRLLVEGQMGPKEIGKRVKMLESQKAVLEDDDDEEAAN